MEIKLKENSDLVVKNHSGDVLCSIDEATGNVIGGGTQLYRHDITFDEDDYGKTDGHFVYFSTSSTPFDDLPLVYPSTGLDVLYVCGVVKSGNEPIVIFAIQDDLYLHFNLSAEVENIPIGGPFVNFHDEVTPL